MRKIIFSTLLILIGCLIGGCSETNHLTKPTTQKNLKVRNDEPFIQPIKKIATKRDGIYFIGDPIDEEEFDRREADLRRLQDFISRTSRAGEHLAGIPILMVTF